MIVAAGGMSAVNAISTPAQEPAKPDAEKATDAKPVDTVTAEKGRFEVVYEGIRLTPAQIVNAALEEGVHVVGLSVLSGSHVALAHEVLAGLRKAWTDVVAEESAKDAKFKKAWDSLTAFRAEYEQYTGRAYKGL